ncbi:MAG: Asp23/Gls24 family envelope stress response protein [Clostridia bacterium]|nr:Asp23/Gls24 family envelope stress response protein [Clostridia bacterium]
MIAYETRTGKVILSNEYLSKLIGNAVTSCYGVVGMVPRGSKQKIIGMVSKKDYMDKGIKVVGDADKISVELHIIVLYGMNINAIAKSIVNKVKYTVNQATGITVEKVTVKVDGIVE